MDYERFIDPRRERARLMRELRVAELKKAEIEKDIARFAELTGDAPTSLLRELVAEWPDAPGAPKLREELARREAPRVQ